MDDLLSHYLTLERLLLKNALSHGIRTDQETYVKVVLQKI